MSERILLTGASGHLGRYAHDRLRQQGWAVSTLAYHPPTDRRDPGSSASGDHPLDGGASTFIHLAGIADRDLATPSGCGDAREFARRAVALANISGAAHALLVSSVYARLAENGEQSVYGAHKIEIEQIFRQEFLGKTTILRLPPVYGGNPDKSSIAKLARLVQRGVPLPLGSATAPRAYLALENLLQLITTVVRTGAQIGEKIATYEPADEVAVSTKEIVHFLGQVLGRRSMTVPVSSKALENLAKIAGKQELVRAAFTPLRTSDNTRLAADMGWHPAVSMPGSLEYLRG